MILLSHHDSERIIQPTYSVISLRAALMKRAMCYRVEPECKDFQTVRSGKVNKSSMSTARNAHIVLLEGTPALPGVFQLLTLTLPDLYDIHSLEALTLWFYLTTRFV